MTLRSITASILTTLSIHSGQAADDFVIQTDLETGLTQHIYVSGPDSIGHKSGVVGSALPVGPAGSVFRLYGVGLAPDTKLYLLDETVVGSFMPEATVSVTSEDPYTVVTRTRADEKFNAKLTFKKLLDDEDAPEAARKVDVERLVEAFYVTKNGSINTQFNTSLASTLPFKQRGEEYIRVYALPDEDIGWTLLDEKRIQVWPIADAQIFGRTSASPEPFPLHGKKVRHMPSITMVASDLYPTSKTYLNLYMGPKNDHPNSAQKISPSITARDYKPVAFNTITPQSATQTIHPDQWDSENLKDGVYTVEILTVTPFNSGKPERLSYATFTLNRTIKVVGSLNVSE